MFFLRLIFLSLLCVGCSSWMNNSTRKIYTTPDRFGYNWEEVTIPLNQEQFLKAWKINAINPDTLLVFFHGNSENRSSHFFHVAWLADYGIDVLSVDYRGFGDSSHVLGGASGADDVKHTLNFVQKNLASRYKKVILYGQSIGGYYLVQALKNWTQDTYAWLILDCTFAEIPSLLKTKAQIKSLTLSPLSLPAKNTLIIHGREDRVIPIALGENLRQRMQGSLFWEIPSGKHLDVFIAHDKIYRSQLLNLLGQGSVTKKQNVLSEIELLALKEQFSSVVCPKLDNLVYQASLIFPQDCSRNCSCDWLARYFNQAGSKKLAQMMYRQMGSKAEEQKLICLKTYQDYCAR